MPAALLLATALLPPRPCQGQSVELSRGPYLQLGTPGSIVVRWRTDPATDSWLAYGPSPAQLDMLITDPQAVIDHELTVTGLSPGTRYYYAVGTAAGILAGGDPEHFFTASPPPGVTTPFRVWVLGDSGTADEGAAAVRDGYLDYLGGRATDLWLMLGDNAYMYGTDEEYQAAVFEMYPQFLRSAVLWPTIGNHDAFSSNSASQTGPYFDIFTLPDWAQAGGSPSGTEAYFSFDYANVHFVNLDSSDSALDPSSTMIQWLAADLATTTQPWIVAYLHHPPYSKGSHDSDDPLDSGGRLFAVRENVLPILEDRGVDLVLAGHSHVYERSYLLDGHYGTSDTLDPDTMILDAGDGRPWGDGAYLKMHLPHAGAVYVVAGSSGVVYSGPLDHPVHYIGLPELGSLVLEFAGSRLGVLFIDTHGSALDYFSLVKTIFHDGFESGDSSEWN
jgi:hypothetical protein